VTKYDPEPGFATVNDPLTVPDAVWLQDTGVTAGDENVQAPTVCVNPDPVMVTDEPGAPDVGFNVIDAPIRVKLAVVVIPLESAKVIT
jgi:hypothetical protein